MVNISPGKNSIGFASDRLAVTEFALLDSTWRSVRSVLGDVTAAGRHIKRPHDEPVSIVQSPKFAENKKKTFPSGTAYRSV